MINAAEGPHGIVIRPMAPGEEPAVADLVMRTFQTFIGHEYEDRGVAEFASYAAASALGDRTERGEAFTLVAVAGDDLAGMIEVRGIDYISLLFVDARFQRRGIARALLEAALDVLGEDRPPSMDVKSSRYAVEVYRSLGFEVSGPEQTVEGIIFIPMRREP